MSIKSDVSLIRGLLYLHEVIAHKTINKAAEANGIKPSNLSVLITELENQVNAKLLIRTPQGCLPTVMGKVFCNLAGELQNFIFEIRESSVAAHAQPSVLHVFVAPNLDFCDCSEFEQKFPEIRLEPVPKQQDADFLILNTPPKETNLSYSEFNIGSNIKQKIWLCCRDSKAETLRFFDFIVAKLLPIYAQSMPLSSEDSGSPCAK